MTGNYDKKTYDLLTKPLPQILSARSLGRNICDSQNQLSRGGDVYDAIITDASGASISADIATLLGYLEAGGDIHDVLYADAVGASLAVDIATIITDTNELQVDWVNGGRLDLLIDELTTQGDTNETKIDAVQTDVGNPSARTNQQTIEAMLGNPDTANCDIYGAIGDEYINADGVPEVDNIRAHQFKTGFKAGGLAEKTITFDGSVSYTAFTVTGGIDAQVIGYITTALTNHADPVSVGTATSVAGLIASTQGDAMQVQNTWWVDNAPSKFKTFPTTTHLIGNGEDITVTGTANIVAGVVTLYCLWTPFGSGTVVSA